MSDKVEVYSLPPCQLHSDGTLAEYDAKTIWGPWAYVCVRCFRKYTSGRLGTGLGQRLVLKPENPLDKS